MIKLSIITVVYNACNDLIKTIDSIKSQKNKDFEYIVIDGKSTDGTVDIIKKENIINKYISEKDNGIYDAMNKGIKLASGEMILFLNAGDVLYDEYVTDKAINIFKKSKIDVAYGDVLLENNKMNIIKTQPKCLDIKYLYTNNLCHQSVFFNKKLFNDIGEFNINEKIFADYEYILKLYKLKVKFEHINFTVCKYDNVNGVSSKLNKVNSMISRAKIVFSVYRLIGLIIFIIFNITIKPINYAKFNMVNKLKLNLNGEKL